MTVLLYSNRWSTPLAVTFIYCTYTYIATSLITYIVTYTQRYIVFFCISLNIGYVGKMFVALYFVLRTILYFEPPHPL